MNIKTKQEFVDRKKEISYSKLASLNQKEKSLLLSLLRQKITTSKYDVPISIFNNIYLSSLEAIVKYLVEEFDLSFSEIGGLLNRSDKTIWITHNKASKKMKKGSLILDLNITIPIQILQNRRLSVLENIVVYLKENYMFNYQEIAKFLNRDYKTIVTVYRRALRKRKKMLLK